MCGFLSFFCVWIQVSEDDSCIACAEFNNVRFPFKVNQANTQPNVNCCENKTKMMKVCAQCPPTHTHTHGLKNKRKPNENYHLCTNFVRFGSAIYWPFHRFKILNWKNAIHFYGLENKWCGWIHEITSHTFILWMTSTLQFRAQNFTYFCFTPVESSIINSTNTLIKYWLHRKQVAMMAPWRPQCRFGHICAFLCVNCWSKLIDFPQVIKRFAKI